MQVAPLSGKIRNLCKHHLVRFNSQGPNCAFSNVWKIGLRICLNTYTLRLFKLPARAGNAHCAGPARPASSSRLFCTETSTNYCRNCASVRNAQPLICLFPLTFMFVFVLVFVFVFVFLYMRKAQPHV